MSGEGLISMAKDYHLQPKDPIDDTTFFTPA